MTAPFDDTPITTHTTLRSAKQGLLPGTPVYIGEHKPFLPTLHVIRYGKDCFEEKMFESLETFEAYVSQLDEEKLTESCILWVNVDGLGDPDLMTALGKRYQINPLALEDILNTHQRTKVDDYEQYLFIVMKMLEPRYTNQNGTLPPTQKAIKGQSSKQDDKQTRASQRLNIDYEQVSFILGKNTLLTFLEDPGDVFDSIRYQLRENKGKIRRLGTDYLLYALIDAIVDQYFGIMELFGEHLEHLSDALLRNPTPNTLKTIHRLRQQTIRLRRVLWPLREVLGHLQRDDTDLIQDGTKIYLRDVYDHAIEVIDTLETNRDILAGMAEMYLSASSYQLNVIMKILTIMSTIFIPLTFITSVYGMNFKYMPELESPWGYPIVWGIMLILGGGMLYYFKKQRWLD